MTSQRKNKRKTVRLAILAPALVILLAAAVEGHFVALIPSEDIVSQPEAKNIDLSIAFMHPFEQEYLNMAKPKAFGVLSRAGKEDLLPSLKESKTGNATRWKSTYQVKRPGDHLFYLEPAPYWEEAEKRFIIHYTKVAASAFGLEEGWSKEVGMKTEIIPLTRPYGLWTGNVFQGVVKVDGKPSAHARVEVEYYNVHGTVKAPSPPYVTQVVYTDDNGVFTYAMPKAGWWGFAALSTAQFTLSHEGKEYPVEIGALLWVRTRDIK